MRLAKFAYNDIITMEDGHINEREREREKEREREREEREAHTVSISILSSFNNMRT